MENGSVTEYRAKCGTCHWHGKTFGNKMAAEMELGLHVTNQKHEDGLVEESTKSNNYPQMSEEEAKLLFIRQSAQEAYEQGNVIEETKGILKTIVEILIVSNMTKEEIGLHISRLEKARSFLAAHTQGIQIAFAKEQEPIFKAKREKERLERAKSAPALSARDKQVNELIELGRRLAAGESKPKVIQKTECSKCKQLVYSLNFHKCMGE